MQEKNLIQALLGLAFSLAFSVALLPGCSGSSADNGAAVDPSSLTINAMARPEGGPGEGSALRFRATLTRPQPQAVTVRYATSAITATAEEDYRDTSGELIIPAGALEGFNAPAPVDPTVTPCPWPLPPMHSSTPCTNRV